MATGYGVRAWALDAIGNRFIAMKAINDGGAVEDEVAIDSGTSYTYTVTEAGNPVLKLDQSVTLTISPSTTITEIVLECTSYGTGNLSGDITYQIGGSTGEQFPDGGEIEVTSFEVQLSDI